MGILRAPRTGIGLIGTLIGVILALPAGALDGQAVEYRELRKEKLEPILIAEEIYDWGWCGNDAIFFSGRKVNKDGRHQTGVFHFELKAQRLTNLRQGLIDHPRACSPDGRFVIFEAGEWIGTGFINTKSGNEGVISKGLTVNLYWSPDSKFVAIFPNTGGSPPTKKDTEHVNVSKEHFPFQVRYIVGEINNFVWLPDSSGAVIQATSAIGRKTRIVSMPEKYFSGHDGERVCVSVDGKVADEFGLNNISGNGIITARIGNTRRVIDTALCDYAPLIAGHNLVCKRYLIGDSENFAKMEYISTMPSGAVLASFQHKETLELYVMDKERIMMKIASHKETEAVDSSDGRRLLLMSRDRVGDERKASLYVIEVGE